MLSCVLLFCKPMDYTCQAPVYMEFSRQEYWSGLPFPSPVKENFKLHAIFQVQNNILVFLQFWNYLMLKEVVSVFIYFFLLSPFLVSWGTSEKDYLFAYENILLQITLKKNILWHTIFYHYWKIKMKTIKRKRKKVFVFLLMLLSLT